MKNMLPYKIRRRRRCRNSFERRTALRPAEHASPAVDQPILSSTFPACGIRVYRGTLLIRTPDPVGPFGGPMVVLGAGQVIMSEVPL